MTGEQQPKRTIDERIDAMAQTMELLQAESLETSKQIRKLGKYIRAVAGMVLDHEARLRVVEGDNDNGQKGEDK